MPPISLAALSMAAARALPPEPQLIDIDGTLFVQLALFLIVFAVLSILFFRPFLKLQDEREKVTEGPKRDARDFDARALELAQEYDQKVAAARGRALDERQVSRAEAARREHEIRDAARQQAQKTLEAARTKMRTDADRERDSLLGRVDALARDMATRVLGRAL